MSDKLYADILQIRDSIRNETKRAIKRQVPKSLAVRNEIRDNLVELFNTFTSTLAVHWFKLGDNQKQQYKQIFLQIRDKIVRSFQILDVKYKVPTSIIESINPKITENDTEDSEEEETMALSTFEFFNLASKLVPLEFDGSVDKLQSFLDSLTLLQANSEGHTDRALAFIKTRLTGKARDLISDDMTLDDIVRTLKNNIKGESSKVVSAKLLTLKQNFKDTSKFAAEIESLAISLKKAYITEGVPNAVAQTYATDTAVKSLIKNAASERTRLVMEAGTFPTIQDAISKLVSIEADSNNSATVLYNTKRGHKNYHYRNSAKYSQKYQHNTQRTQYRNQRQQQYPRNSSHQYSNRNHHERHVRVCTNKEITNSQGNESFPQQKLGETQM